MNIKILCVGKLKEKYWKDAESEYVKRMSKYCNLSIEEVKEERMADNPFPADCEKVKKAEGQRILKMIQSDDYVIALDLCGQALTSEGLSEKLEGLALRGKSKIVFLIGGSIGIGAELLNRADFKISFSKMTFPHQLMRIILLEQIYRSFKILKNETYHK